MATLTVEIGKSTARLMCEMFILFVKTKSYDTPGNPGLLIISVTMGPFLGRCDIRLMWNIGAHDKNTSKSERYQEIGTFHPL